MKRLLLTALIFALLGVASSAVAQTIRNPSGATFTPSADHATITSYEIGWFLTGAVEPVSTVDIGKPAPDGTNTCAIAINVMPLAFNEYTAKIRAKAGTVYSDWSDPSNGFQRVPGRPGKPAVK